MVAVCDFLDDTAAPMEQLKLALENIRAAYDRAEQSSGFKTYQLDTYHMRLLLHIEAHNLAPAEDTGHWTEIGNLLDRFDAMLRDEAHRDFVVRVLEGVEDVVSPRGPYLGSTEKRTLTSRLQRIAEALEQLPLEIKQTSSTEPVRFSILRTIHKISS